MINVGGENVFAWEVEQVMCRMQDVKECAAFSMPHEVLGEVVEAAIVRSGDQVTEARVASGGNADDDGRHTLAQARHRAKH